MQAKMFRAVALQEQPRVYFITRHTAITAAAGLSTSFQLNQLLKKEATDLVDIKRDCMKVQVFVKTNLLRKSFDLEVFEKETGASNINLSACDCKYNYCLNCDVLCAHYSPRCLVL